MTDLSVPFSFPATAMSDFGQGIDLVSGVARAYGAIMPPSLRTGPINNAISNVQVVATQDDYSSIVNSVFDAQGSTLTGSFSAGFSLLEKSQMSQSSFSMVIGTTVQTRINVIVDPSSVRLTDAAANALSTQGPAAFQAEYGTHFIGGFIEGGDYFGTINILFSSLEDQKSFSAYASGSISEGIASGSVNTKFSKALSSIQSKYSLNSYVSQNGNIQSSNSADPDSMISDCNAFSKALQSDPTGGRRIIAIGFPWNQIPRVREILHDIGQLHALDVTVSEEVALILRREKAALGYLAHTASSLADTSLPTIVTTLIRRYGNDIMALRNRIDDLRLGQVEQMDTNAAMSFCLSPKFKLALAILSRGKLPVNWTYALDGSFLVPTLDGGGVFEASLIDNPQWIFSANHAGHDDPPQRGTVGLLYNANCESLQAVFDWDDPYGPGSGRWFGNAIDLNRDSYNRSIASWPTYPWNQGGVSLLA